jgi:hypothetical protein
MTREEWDNCTDPQPMLAFLQDSKKSQERKTRLFVAACARSIWDQLALHPMKAAVVAAEDYADGAATLGDLILARNAICDLVLKRELIVPMHEAFGLCHASVYTPEGLASLVASDTCPANEVRFGWERGRVLVRDRAPAILRDIFGPIPFGYAAADPSWLAWNGGAIGSLAQAIYTERAFDRMPILADALEEAGCFRHEILSHCRGGGTHCRGCWVLDLLLGKE